MINLGNVFILGDSYSTFKGYIPEGYAVYYSENSTDFGVDRVENTWWMSLINETDSALVHNNSWSGSTIGYTGYSGDCTNSSFITRFEHLLEQGWFEENKIDTFFVFGGTNDSWSNAPLGELKLADWGREDLFSVLPAIGYIAHRLKTALTDTRVIFIINTDIKTEIQEGIKKACGHFGAEYIALEDISKIEGHPTKEGMTQIKDQILSYLEN